MRRAVTWPVKFWIFITRIRINKLLPTWMTNQSLVNTLHVDCGHIDCTFFLEILGTQKRALKTWKFPSKIWMICNHGKPHGYTTSGPHLQIYGNRIFHRSKQKPISGLLNIEEVQSPSSKHAMASQIAEPHYLLPSNTTETKQKISSAKSSFQSLTQFRPANWSREWSPSLHSVIILICIISLFSRLQETLRQGTS